MARSHHPKLSATTLGLFFIPLYGHHISVGVSLITVITKTMHRWRRTKCTDQTLFLFLKKDLTYYHVATFQRPGQTWALNQQTMTYYLTTKNFLAIHQFTRFSCSFDSSFSHSRLISSAMSRARRTIPNGRFSHYLGTTSVSLLLLGQIILCVSIVLNLFLE
jgi:hypothetical protein